MKSLVFINPLKPGKLKEYKAFSAENTGPRKQDYIDLLHRYGLRNVKVYYHKLEDKEFIIVLHDAEDDALERLKNFSSSTNSYDCWFKEQLENLHDLDDNPHPELLFNFEPKQSK